MRAEVLARYGGLFYWLAVGSTRKGERGAAVAVAAAATESEAAPFIPPIIMIRSILAALLLAAPVQARPVTATVYDGWYHGRQTACGQTYQHWGISAAHPWLPCGTPVRISHAGRSLTVPITDRCECNSIDLSAGAAYRLGVPLDGIATVSIRY